MVVSDDNPALDHWERVYKLSDPEQVSWHQDVPATSLDLIEKTGEVAGTS